MQVVPTVPNASQRRDFVQPLFLCGFSMQAPGLSLTDKERISFRSGWSGGGVYPAASVSLLFVYSGGV